MTKSAALAAQALSPMPSFDPLDRATLQDQAYQKLRAAVMGGVFEPGTPITIRAAADALGVSPMPVRAALQRLEVEGALEAYGSKRSLRIPALTATQYRELRDVRIVLEGYAAERAAETIDDSEVELVERNCAAMQAAADAGDTHGYVSANWVFHLSIYRASRMTTLVGMIEALWLRVGPYVQLMMPDRESLTASMPEHWRVVDALRRRNGAAARREIAEDITHSAVNLLRVLPRA